MIVLGADMHKSSHTIAAVAAATGELASEKTIDVGARGFAAALDWARDLGAERVWALEDCRHVSGAFERFLLVSGERVVRVATRLMAGERRGGRDRGKSDRIDAMAVARAALREGFDRLPVAELAGVELGDCPGFCVWGRGDCGHGQSGSRSPKWILSARRALVQR